MLTDIVSSSLHGLLVFVPKYRHPPLTEAPWSGWGILRNVRAAVRPSQPLARTSDRRAAWSDRLTSGGLHQRLKVSAHGRLVR